MPTPSSRSAATAEPANSRGGRYRVPAAGGVESPPLSTPTVHGTRFPQCKKRLVAMVSDKGGVGKSSFLVQLIQWYTEAHPHVKIRAYDPDHSTRTLMSFQPDATDFVDVDQPQSLDAPARTLMESLDVAIYDGLGSQQSKTFLAWAREINYFDIAQTFQIATTFCLIVEQDSDVVEQAAATVASIGDKVDWLIIRNHKQSEHMPLWDASEVRATLLTKLGASEIIYPKIHPELSRFLTEQRVPIAVAAADPSIHVLPRQRYVNLTRMIYGQLENVRSILVPPPGEPQP